MLQPKSNFFLFLKKNFLQNILKDRLKKSLKLLTTWKKILLKNKTFIFLKKKKR